MSKLLDYHLIILNRWGDKDNHTYYAGMSSDKTVADIMGKWFADARGGKYDYRLQQFRVEEHTKYYLLSTYNTSNKENSIPYICYTAAHAIKKLREVWSDKLNIREMFDLEELPIWDIKSISEDVVKDCLLYPDRYNENELKILKDAYEKSVRDNQS